MAKRGSEIKLRISADGSVAVRALNRVRDGIQRLGTQARQAGAALSRVAIGIGAAITAAGAWSLGRFIGDSTEAAEKLDVQMRTLAATIEATGGAAGLTAQDISEMAERLDAATLGSAEEFRAGANALLTFKSVGKDSFETVLRLAKDMEAAGLGSFQQNVKQLGKALEDPARGLTSLRESGVSFTDTQRDVVKQLVATGQAAKAQGIILQEVAGQVGGAAEASAKGLTGLKDAAGQLAKDLQEQFGQARLPGLEAIQKRINALLERLRDSGVVTRFGKAFGEAWESAAGAFLGFVEKLDFDALIEKFRNFVEDARGYIGNLVTSIGGIKGAAETAVSGIKQAFAGLEAVFRGVQTAVDGVALAFTKVAGYFAKNRQQFYEGLSQYNQTFEADALKAGAAAQTLAETQEKLTLRMYGHIDQTVAAGKTVLGIQEQQQKKAGAIKDEQKEQTEETKKGADEAEKLEKRYEGIAGSARKAAQATAQMTDELTGADKKGAESATGAQPDLTDAQQEARRKRQLDEEKSANLYRFQQHQISRAEFELTAQKLDAAKRGESIGEQELAQRKYSLEHGGYGTETNAGGSGLREQQALREQYQGAAQPIVEPVIKGDAMKKLQDQIVANGPIEVPIKFVTRGGQSGTAADIEQAAAVGHRP